jgi:predicted AlkP superfamily phosphohydrolase/phosphomutase
VPDRSDADAAKTVVFGLDGACFDLIGPWLDAGAMPTLQGLIKEGGRSRLKSCVPATTPPAWTSMTTGVNPGKHGVFGFYGRHRGDYGIDPVSDADVGARRLWSYASDADRTSLVVNVPVTHPADELEGALVPGYLSPDSPETAPPDLLSAVGMEDYSVYAPSEADDVSEAQLLEEWLGLTDSRRALSEALMERHDWDLLFVEFQKTDGAVHKFEEETNVRRIYERVDECLAEILDAVDEEANVFVVSDHGIGQPKEWSVALNTWLVEEGYAETTVGSDGKASWIDEATGDGNGGGGSTGDGGARDGDGGGSSDPGVAARLLSAASRAGVTQQRLERLLSALGLYELATRFAPAGVGETLETETIDEAASTAFYQGIGFSGVDVGVTINDERFYDSGTVSDAEYDALRAELMSALRDLEGPDGTAPFTSVQPREAVYEGPALKYAPDIVLEQAADYVIGSSEPRGQTFIPADTGRIDHTRHGLLVAAGPDIESEWDLAEVPSIVDVTPTLLALLGVPLDERFDGAPLSEVLAGDLEVAWQEYGPVESCREYAFSDSEEEALEERLGAMGYME